MATTASSSPRIRSLVASTACSRALQLGQQLVELQVRKQLRPTLRFHQQSFPMTMHRKTIGRPPCRLETRLAI